jgi:transcriptional regulator with XRE-family HTH domain
MSSIRIQLGRVIRQLRSEAGYSQEAFADAIGVHRNYMGTVERGETNITIENLEKIARGLRVRLSELMARAESHPGEPME